MIGRARRPMAIAAFAICRGARALRLRAPEQSNHEEREVKKFVLLHYGFEKPTPEIMQAWGTWFESVADRTVDQGGFSSGREISASGTNDLPMGMESITGYNV